MKKVHFAILVVLGSVVIASANASSSSNQDSKNKSSNHFSKEAKEACIGQDEGAVCSYTINSVNSNGKCHKDNEGNFGCVDNK